MEDAETLTVCAATCATLAPSEVSLEAGSNFADVSVRGVRTLWTGVLVGKIDPARSTIDVVRGGGVADGVESLKISDDDNAVAPSK